MSYKKDQSTTISELQKIVYDHLLERDWHQSSSRDTAISIVLEATELLEHYQWSDKPVGDNQELAEELADIINYCLDFARLNNIDITTAVTKKLQKSAQKYPAEKFKNKDPETMRKIWIESKKAYKKTSI